MNSHTTFTPPTTVFVPEHLSLCLRSKHGSNRPKRQRSCGHERGLLSWCTRAYVNILMPRQRARRYFWMLLMSWRNKLFFIVQRCKLDIYEYPVVFKVLFLCSIWGKKALHSENLFLDDLSLGTKLSNSRYSAFWLKSLELCQHEVYP